MNKALAMVKLDVILSSAGIEDTFWGKRIANALEAGSFEASDVERASEWTTCACGESEHEIEIDSSPDAATALPKDKKLVELGFLFHEAVEIDSPFDAADVMIKIEERASALLANPNLLIDNAPAK